MKPIRRSPSLSLGCGGQLVLSLGITLPRHKSNADDVPFTGRPLIGGLLAKSATRYPKYFNYELFKTYPYILPCFLVSSIAGITFIIAFLFLEEVCAAVLKFKSNSHPFLLDPVCGYQSNT
jgi:hypothetical protein